MLAAALARQCARHLHTSVPHLGSALYITGQKASETYSVLTPHIDCDSKFNNISQLQENVSARGLDINVEKLKKSWDFLKSVKETKYQLESRREETSKKIRTLASEKSEKSDSEINGLKILGKMLRDNLKTITKEIWELEESVILRILALPNDLHPDTPLTEEVVIEEGSKPLAQTSPSHLQVGKETDVLKFISPLCYYLQNSAAEFEISLTQYCADFLNNAHYIPTCNSDFVKSVIVEGCGYSHTDPNCVFILQSSDNKEDAKLHLVGGASLLSFCALFTRQETVMSEDPLKLFSLGRHYSPPVHTNMPGLFNVAQESSVELFITTVSCQNQLLAAFNSALELIKELYQSLGLSVRLVRCSASQLKTWESLKVSIQMFSPHTQDYVEVGHVSMCGTYISKRLLMKYQGSDGEKDFLNVVSGRVLNVPRVLACLLEQNELSHVAAKLQHVLKI